MGILAGAISDYDDCREVAACFSESIPNQDIFLELIQNQQLLIAKESQKTIWFISYKTLWNESIMIQFLRIHPKHHRRWIGSQLIQEVEKQLKKKWAYEIMSTVLEDNTASKNLHEKLGYTQSGHINFDSGKEIVYLKVL